jgi:hypothetical protein
VDDFERLDRRKRAASDSARLACSSTPWPTQASGSSLLACCTKSICSPLAATLANLGGAARMSCRSVARVSSELAWRSPLGGTGRAQRGLVREPCEREMARPLLAEVGDGVASRISTTYHAISARWRTCAPARRTGDCEGLRSRR